MLFKTTAQSVGRSSTRYTQDFKIAPKAAVSIGEVSLEDEWLLADPLELHEMVTTGMPTHTLEGIFKSYGYVPKPLLMNAVNVSERTMQRRKDGRLDSQVSGAAVELAAITASAEKTLGSRELAEHWLAEPALAFSGRRPIELLTTRQGANLVRDQLLRMEYGVYA